MFVSFLSCLQPSLFLTLIFVVFHAWLTPQCFVMMFSQEIIVNFVGFRVVISPNPYKLSCVNNVPGLSTIATRAHFGFQTNGSVCLAWIYPVMCYLITQGHSAWPQMYNIMPSPRRRNFLSWQESSSRARFPPSLKHCAFLYFASYILSCSHKMSQKHSP